MSEKIPVDSISDLLNQLDLEDLDEILEENIFSEDTEINESTNAFANVYGIYTNIIETYDFTRDDRELFDFRFEKVCHMFIDKIARKFNINVNYELLDDSNIGLIGSAMTMYEFFIADFEALVQMILINYILKNYDEINSIHDSYKNKKDSATIHYRESNDVSEEFCLIAANIVAISEWILDRFESNDDIMEYVDDDYYLRESIMNLYNSGFITGTFVEKISELYRENLTLKGKVSLNICNMLLNKNKNK